MARIIRPPPYFFSVPAKSFFLTMRLLRCLISGPVLFVLENRHVLFRDLSGHIVFRFKDIDSLHYPCKLPQERYLISFSFDDFYRQINQHKEDYCDDDTRVELFFTQDQLKIDFLAAA